MQMRHVDAEAQPLTDCDDIPAAQQHADFSLSAPVGRGT